jgi:hypothetical protein
MVKVESVTQCVTRVNGAFRKGECGRTGVNKGALGKASAMARAAIDT